MRGYNKAIIAGHLGADPEVRQTSSGNSVANLSVATKEVWKDKNTGDNQERTEWHRVVLWGKLADIAGQYLKKGAAVLIEGSIQTRKWQDQNGNDRYSTEIVGKEMQFLGDGKSGQPEQSRPAAPPQETQAPAHEQLEYDDIPF